MRRSLVAILLTFAAASACAGQTPARQPKPAQQKPAPSNADVARQEINVGARLYRAGRYAEAEQHFRRALELDPDAKDTRTFIARAVQQQFKPGDTTPENVAAGERAVAAYQDVLARDPANEDAYKATVLLYGQMKREDKVVELLTQRGNDFSLPNEKRAEAFATLASRHWQCSHDLTERKENKESKPVEGQPEKAVVKYNMPADQSDFLRARQCVTDGLQFVEQALALDPKSRGGWSFKSNLLREAAKLAEMEGNAAQKGDYDRQAEEAAEALRRLGAVTPPLNVEAGTTTVAPTATPEPKGTVISGGVLNGKAVSKPQPEYPEIAKAARASGTVTVQVVVDEEGNVISASAVSGHPLLQQAAVQAARAAKFSPTHLSGRPVKVSGVVTYNFVLR